MGFEMTFYLKIPKERIGVLIGKNGEFKDRLEKRCRLTLQIDSETGDVTIPEETTQDPYLALKAGDIVKAVARGFSPERSMVLLNDDYYLAVLDIRDYVGKSSKHIHRIRSRLIGSDGKTRRLIEELGEVELSIYGNTVGIIGDMYSIEIGKTAVDMVLSGSEHSSVYSYLENKRREMKLRQAGF